jgi:DNA-binding XRE family transcriptional regulator
MGIGTKIRRLRNLNSKMSQEELAYKLSLAQTTISNIESNKVNPDFSTILKICAIFDVGLDYFTENVTDMYSLKKNENNTIPSYGRKIFLPTFFCFIFQK